MKQGRGKGAAFKRQRSSVCSAGGGSLAVGGAVSGGGGENSAVGNAGSSSSSSNNNNRRRGTKPKVKRHGVSSDASKDDDSDDHRATTVITTVKDEFTLTQVGGTGQTISASSHSDILSKTNPQKLETICLGGIPQIFRLSFQFVLCLDVVVARVGQRQFFLFSGHVYELRCVWKRRRESADLMRAVRSELPSLLRRSQGENQSVFPAVVTA